MKIKLVGLFSVSAVACKRNGAQGFAPTNLCTASPGNKFPASPENEFCSS